MSGTPSISDDYAVVGDRRHAPSGPRLAPWVTLVLLRRGPAALFPSVLAEVWDLGFAEVLVVETNPGSGDPVGWARLFPGTRVLVPRRPWNGGEAINRAADEVVTEKFLVLWDDQSIPEAGVSSRVGQRWSGDDWAALIPDRFDLGGRPIPSVRVPVLQGSRLKILAWGSDQESVDTLFPTDYTALYHRRRFQLSGGYDPTLTNAFWQQADWGFRSWLWGETLTVEPGFRVDYRRQPPVEDQTPDRSYPRFYLRNLAVRFTGDHGILPWGRLGAHLRRSGQRWGAAWAGFVQERRWVRTHRYRFRTDARTTAERWGGE